MKVLFWLSAITIAYVYVGYPAVLAVWARLARPSRRPAAEASVLPKVSVLLAVRNEGARLAARIENLLALDYPRDLLEIVVVSNGSTDETHAVLAKHSERVNAFVLGATGKAKALNVAVAHASHEILVFADGRQQFAPDAVRRLVEAFSDPAVGGVSGELVLDSEAAPAETDGEPASAVGEGVGLYWRYEKWLRRHESDVHSVLGATGAIYALRRSLWRPLPPDTLLDDVLAPMLAVLAGRRIVFEPRAKAYDRASPDAATEGRRKERTLAGNYQLLWIEPRLLVPLVNPVWIQFVSHKVGRLVVPYALLTLLISSTALAPTSPVYGLALTMQVVFYLLAVHGALVVGDRSRVPAPAASVAAAPRSAAAVAAPRQFRPKRVVPASSRRVRKEMADAQAD